ncbi:MAG: bestrophin family ion channel, partial [Candidatus Sericytochromatia bacterium]
KFNLEGNFTLNEMSYVKKENLENISHNPSAVAKIIYEKIYTLYESKLIDIYQLVDLNKHVEIFIDLTGGCERIKKTPIPYSYNLHLKKYIFVYSITLPWGLMHDIRYWTVPAVMLIFYAMVGIEIIGEEIEDPFSGDPDDLPLQIFCENISKNVREILN